jgi:hypothetical protein
VHRGVREPRFQCITLQGQRNVEFDGHYLYVSIVESVPCPLHVQDIYDNFVLNIT